MYPEKRQHVACFDWGSKTRNDAAIILSSQSVSAMGCYTRTIFNATSLQIVPLKIIQCDITFRICTFSSPYAGITLTPHSAPGLLYNTPKCVPSPRASLQQKMPGGRPINDDVPVAELLHQLAFKHKNC